MRFVEDALKAKRRQGDRRNNAVPTDKDELDIDAFRAQPGVDDSHDFSIHIDEVRRRLDLLIDKRLSEIEEEDRDARHRFDAFEAEQAPLTKRAPIDEIHQIQRKDFTEKALARTKEYNELCAMLRELNEKAS